MSSPKTSGPKHYREAEQLIDLAGEYEVDGDPTARATSCYRAAQVHATLALAAATAYPAVRDYWGDEDDTCREWAGVAS